MRWAMLSGKKGAVQWTMWGLWAAALGGKMAMQWVVLLGGGSSGEEAVRQATQSPAAALGGWVAKGWMTNNADVDTDNIVTTQMTDDDADDEQQSKQ
jgi:hypothetical protein